MKNAEKVLKEKGYNAEEIMNILQANDKSLDMEVRESYGLGDQPLHLFDSYYIGDADEEAVMDAARNSGFQDIDDLLSQMDNDLIELAEKYPSNVIYYVEVANYPDKVEEFTDEEEAIRYWNELSESDNAGNIYTIKDGRKVDLFLGTFLD